MPSLYDKLKSIYTAGDTFTVLQLLNEFIEATKGIEVMETPLYRHNIIISSPLTDNERSEVLFTIYSKDDTPMETIAQIRDYIGINHYIPVSGKYIGESNILPIYCIRPGIDESRPFRALIIGDDITYFIPATALITDNVQPLQ